MPTAGLCRVEPDQPYHGSPLSVSTRHNPGGVLLCSSRMTTLPIQLIFFHGLDHGPLSPYIRPHFTLLQEQGYKLSTICQHVRQIGRFNRWLVGTRRILPALEESVIEQFIKCHPKPPRNCALFRFLDFLRTAKVIPAVKPVLLTPAQLLGDRYRRYLLEERGIAAKTALHYVLHVNRFLAQRFGTGPTNPSQLRGSDSIQYVQRIAREYNPPQTKTVVTGLRSFLRYLQYCGDIDTDLASAVPAVAYWRLTSLPKHLPAAAVQRVVDGCDQNTQRGQRDHAILLLLARLGLRAHEVVTLRLDDIDWDNGQLLIRSKKGQGLARMPLPPKVGKALARYLKRARPKCSCRNVFVRTIAPHSPISESNTISGIVRKAIKRAGVSAPRTGAHVLRHSLATAMLRRGASLDEIGQILRHRDVDTTAIYAKVDLDALRPLALAWPGGAQ